MTALNAMITIGLSVPFMFTTAGWLSIVFQIAAASAIFLCVLLVRACIDNPKVLYESIDADRGIPAQRLYPNL